MAIIGRLACPWCGFHGAHVKRNDGKKAYHHCPECGLMTHAKTGAQERLLTGTMRPEGVPEPPATDDPIVMPKATAAPPAPAPEPPKKPQGFWSQLGGN